MSVQKLCKGWLVCKVVGVSWAFQALALCLFSLLSLLPLAFYIFLHQK